MERTNILKKIIKKIKIKNTLWLVFEAKLLVWNKLRLVALAFQAEVGTREMLCCPLPEGTETPPTGCH